MTDRLDKKIALVTGASRGLGRAVAERLGALGAHVVALARTVGGLEDLADAVEASGGSTTLVPLDITDDQGVQRMCAALYDRFGHVDIWVHTAAYAAPLSPAAHVAEKELDRTIAINIRATQRLVTCVEPLLKASGRGQAVLVSDPAAGQPFFGAYGASKAAQAALFKSWAEESRSLGPDVTLVDAPPMPTAVRARFYPGEPRETLAPTSQAAEALVEMLLHQRAAQAEA